MDRTASRSPAPLTWLGGEWRRGFWLHPVLVAVGTIVAGMVAHLVRLPIWYAAGFTAVAGMVGMLATGGPRFAEAARGFMIGAGLVTGGWLALVSATSPVDAPSVVTAVVGTLAFSAAYPKMRLAQRRHEERVRALAQRRVPPSDKPVRPDARRWEQFMASVGLKGLTFLERVPNKAGFSVRFRLPSTGVVTFAQVANAAHRIEIGFPKGRDGMVRVERARDEYGRELAGEVLVHLDVRDILTERIDMPAEHSPLSINEAFPVGEYTDGEPIYLTLREVAALIVGLRGRGKTNLFTVLVHQLSRCVDVCLWAIDLKGGRAVKPWLRPWLSGQVGRPVFDWVATTRAEAWLMLKGAHGLITQRGRTGSGGSKIVPSPELPAVLVLIDEVAALVGRYSGPRFRTDGEGPTANDFSGVLTLNIQLGRSEAVDFALCTQRATVTMTGTGDLKSQCELRIGLGVSNAQDARSLFEGDAVAARILEKFRGRRTRGALLVQEGEDRVLPGKCFFYGDGEQMLHRIHATAIAHADLPASLDAAGQRAVETAVRLASDGRYGYLDRWDTARAAHLYSDDVPPEVTDEGSDFPEHPATGVTRQAGRSGTVAVTGRGDGAGRRNRFFPKREPGRPVVESQPSTADDPAWERIITQYAGSDAPPESEQPGDATAGSALDS